MSDEALSAEELAVQRDALVTELARLRAARDTGVPVDLLINATTEDEARSLAESLLAWKAASAPPEPEPSTANQSFQVGQISRSALQYLSPKEINLAYREGRLANEVGALGAPPPRQDGQHRR